MLFADVVATSERVGATSSRTAKRDALADLLKRLAPDEVEAAVGFLTGEVRQGSIGVGWNTIVKAQPGGEAAAAKQDSEPVGPPLTVEDVDTSLSTLARTTGAGSQARRHEVLAELFGRATEAESTFLSSLLTGQLRQGALAGVMADAVAAAAGIPAAVVRRATMLGGRLDATARLALTEGREALEAVVLQPGRAIQPMLASTASSVAAAVEDLAPASVEWKLDGLRIQVHRVDGRITVFSRNLNDITGRVPGVVEVVRGLRAERLVLDGEAMLIDEAGRPALFQDTVSGGQESRLRPFFFDLLHLDGRDMLDEPLEVRRRALADLAPDWLVPAQITVDPDLGEQVLAEALAAGHEGAVVKGVSSTYDAGRRGKAWRKVKPVHTLDLVVLAVEWGSGRRTGWLSNLHLGARSPDGGFVMVGKTFKGLTDELLRWQTERFLGLAEREESWGREQTGVVWVRPEQVVEIALDGVQRSTRYPGGVALRFARVVRYRSDKGATDADTIDAVRQFLPTDV